MKRYILTLALTPLLLLFACTPADEGIEGDADTLGIDLDQEMTEFRAEVDETLMEVDMRLDSLQAWAATATADEREEADSALADLRERRDSVQQDMQQLQMAGEEEFEDVRADIERELDELESDLEAAWDRFREEDGDMDAI